MYVSANCLSIRGSNDTDRVTIHVDVTEQNKTATYQHFSDEATFPEAYGCSDDGAQVDNDESLTQMERTQTSSSQTSAAVAYVARGETVKRKRFFNYRHRLEAAVRLPSCDLDTIIF